MQHWSPGATKWAPLFEAVPLSTYTPPGIESALEYHSPAFPVLNDTTAMLLSQWQTGANKSTKRVAEERPIERGVRTMMETQEFGSVHWTDSTGNVGRDELDVNALPKIVSPRTEKNNPFDIIDLWCQINTGKAPISPELEVPQAHFPRSFDVPTLKKAASCQQKRIDEDLPKCVQGGAWESLDVRENIPKVLDSITDRRSEEVDFSPESLVDRIFFIFSASALNSVRWLDDVRPIFSASQVRELVAPDGSVSLERVCDALSRLVEEGKCEVVWVEEEGDERMQYRAA